MIFRRAVLLIGVVALVACTRSQRFDAEVWQDTVRIQEHARLRMVDDLLKRYELIGMTDADVDQLLGPGDDTPYFASYDRVYWLGPERGPFGMDSEWLVLRQDSTGHVVERRVVTD